MDNMEWVDRNNESELIRDGVTVARVVAGRDRQWWIHMHGQQWPKEHRDVAKAAVEKEVGK